MTATILPLGDAAAIVAWPELTDLQAARHVVALQRELRAHWNPGYLSVVPAFASLTLHYSPLQLSWQDVQNQIRLHSGHLEGHSSGSIRRVEIPVCYEHDFAPDLGHVAQSHGISKEDVIALHVGADYVVRMIGFSPGFPYLAGLPESLATPRRASPRLVVPKGSVAIGGSQTGIYSLETPGGWNIIGRTPLAMFRPDLSPPCLLNAGDRVRFVPISQNVFEQWPNEQWPPEHVAHHEHNGQQEP